MNRNDGIDAIKILLTVLVVIHHISIVYGGAGSWYWKEVESTKIYLVAFNAVNQSFFMGFFFLLSGYFSRASIDKKGIKAFLEDRFIRLGIPLVVYFFVISPFTIALANPQPGITLVDQTLNMIMAKEFEPGPLWFVFSLLIFCSLFSFIYRFSPQLIRTLTEIPKPLWLAIFLVLVGLFTFIVRLFIPTGETVFWLQLGYFPMYIIFFIVGVYTQPKKLLLSVDFKEIKIWLIISFLLISILPIVLLYPMSNGAFEGGINVNALFYALWEPFVAIGIIFGLLSVFGVHIKVPKNVTRFLSPLAYSMYIIHPPIVVLTSLMLFHWSQSSLVKILVNSSISVALCIAISWFILRLPYVSRVL